MARSNPVFPAFLLDTIRLADLRRAAGRLLRYWADVPKAEPLPPGHEGLSVCIADVHPGDFWPLANHYDLDDFGPFVLRVRGRQRRHLGCHHVETVVVSIVVVGDWDANFWTLAARSLLVTAGFTWLG